MNLQILEVWWANRQKYDGPIAGPGSNLLFTDLNPIDKLKPTIGFGRHIGSSSEDLKYTNSVQYIVTTHKLHIEIEELIKVELHAYITSSNEYYSEARGSQHT